MYKVRVAASGQKVAVYKDDKIVKVIQASDDTFKPAEAVKYAEELNCELQKSAEQMQDPAGPIVTPTKAEQQTIDLPKTQTPATGIGGSEIMDIKAKLVEAQKAIQSLQLENAQLKDATIIERKARRGLAIAKQEVLSNKIASTESTIEERVLEITAMSDEDITLLERKTAGLSEFESITQANKYASSMKIKARMYRQAAEEAMENGAEHEACKHEATADHCDARATVAESFIQQAQSGDVDDDETMDMEMGVEASLNCASDDNDEDDEEKEASVELGQRLASLYSKTAKCLSVLAKKASAEGQDEVAKEAQQEAEIALKNAEILNNASDDEDDDDIEPTANTLANLYAETAEVLNKIADEATASGNDEVVKEAKEEAEIALKNAETLMNPDSDDDFDPKDIIEHVQEQATGEAPNMNYAAELNTLYSKIAKNLHQIAKEAEANGNDAVVKEAKEEAEDAEKKASIFENATADNVGENLVDLYNKVASYLEKIAEDAEMNGKEAVADEADQEAKSARRKARILLAASECEDDNKDDDQKQAASEDDDETKEAAVEEDEEEDKKASKIVAVKTYSDGVTKIASVEENPLAFDPSIEALSTQLWGRNTID
jgi:hypothetical protein